MSIVTVRPGSVYGYSSLYDWRWHDSGGISNGPGSNAHTYLRDNDDNTWIFGVTNGAWYDFDTDDYTLAANERCIQARMVARLQSNSNIFPINCDFWLRPVVAGDQPGQNISGVVGSPTTYWGAWAVGEWSQSAINAMRIDIRDNGNTTVGNWYELYLDLDIRHQPWASGVTPSGTQSTRTPTVGWAFNDTEGGAQVAYRVAVYTSAQGSPGGGDATYDSGNVGNANGSQVLPTLPNGTYYAYVAVAKDFLGSWWWSGWASTTFTVNLPPDLPTGLARTSTVGVTTPTFSVSVSEPGTAQVKARFNLYQSDGTTLIGTIDSAYVTGSGTVTATYGTALALGTYKVQAQAIDGNGNVSAWTAQITFQINVIVPVTSILLWDVASPTVAVPKDSVLLWNVDELKAKQLTLVWTVFSGVTIDSTLLWNVATSWVHVADDSGTVWTEITEL